MTTAQQKTHEQKTLGMRIFAVLYFPLQYLVVRCLLFGIRLTPTPTDILHALNIEGIISVIREMVQSIGSIVSAEHVIILIANFLPYLSRLAVLLLPIGLYFYTLFTLMVYILAQVDIFFHDRMHINRDVRVHVLVGQPGSGKSSSAGYDVVRTAARMWEELRWKYLTMCEQVSDYLRDGNIQKLMEWYEVRDSYNFYMSSDCVPCLWSNIPLTSRGQNVNRLTFEHLAQMERIPYYSCLYVDEIGSVLRLNMSSSKILTISDFFRLERHAGDFVIFCTEQEESNIYIDFRRVAGENRYMLSQRHVNKPLALLLPFLLIRRLMLWTDCSYKPLAKFMRKYQAILSHIGQRRYVYIVKGNQIMGGSPEANQTGKGKRVRKVVMYLPPQLNYQYDDRTFRNLYLAKDKELKEDIFPSLIIEDTKENLERYLKSTEPKTWQEATTPRKYKKVLSKGKEGGKKSA